MTRASPVAGAGKDADFSERRELPARRWALEVNATVHFFTHLAHQTNAAWLGVIGAAQTRRAGCFTIGQCIRQTPAFAL